MPSNYRVSITLYLVAFVLGNGVAFAQTPQRDPAIDRLAGETAQQVKKIHAKRILLSPLQNCLRDSLLCEQLDTALRDDLGSVGADPQFVTREEVKSALMKRGFMSIDAYNGEVLRLIASDLQADLLVIENMLWNPQIIGLSSEVIEIAKERSVGKFTEKFHTPFSPNDEPVLVKDEQTGVSLIVFPFSKRNYVIKVPTCNSCPAPLYSVEMLKAKYQGVVRLQATITEQGLPDQIGVVEAPNPVIAKSAIATAQRWHFNPAVGADGKSFAARMPIEVTFQLAQ